MQAEALLALAFISRLILGIVLLRSAWGKLTDVAGFARGLAAYQLLPAPTIAPLAWLLPLLEGALALAFLLGWVLPLAGMVAALLLLTFTVAIVINLRRGRVVSCNCHGSAQQTPISWGLVARNALLLVLAILLAAFSPALFTPLAVSAHWQAERDVLFTSAIVPALMLLGWTVAYLTLLPALIDVRRAVRQAIR